MKSNFLVIIPARLKSSRLPGKPLKLIKGMPLIYWTWNNCKKVVPENKIYIATDSNKIDAVCKKLGIQTIMTDPNHKTGTDRIAEAVKKLKSDLIINLQGDEPFINSTDLKSFIYFALKNKKYVTNAYTEVSLANSKNVNIPKVVINSEEYLMYISRSSIPGCKLKLKKKFKTYKQVCMYGFPKNFLTKLFGLKKNKSNLEKVEDIEILRVLEAGYKVKMLKVKDNLVAVDTHADLKKARQIMNETKRTSSIL